MREPAELHWSTRRQAAALVCRGATFDPSARIAAVVGTLLTLVNQGTVIASGATDWATVLRVVGNYLIPYVVSSIGFLSSYRRPGPS